MNDIFSFTALFSRTAAVCMTLGFVVLVAIVVLAILRTNKPRQYTKEPSKGLQGLSTKIQLEIANLFLYL